MREFQRERAGLCIDVPDNNLLDNSLNKLDNRGLSCGLERDYTYKSSLSGNNVRYNKPTQERQRIQRLAVKNIRQKYLLNALQSLLYLRNRGGVKI